MVDYFISFMVGLCTGIATGLKDKDWKEQERMYGARLQEQANAIDYYKRLTKNLVDENAQLRQTQIEKEKPAKYTDEWWKEVAEFNKQLKAQEK